MSSILQVPLFLIAGLIGFQVPPLGLSSYREDDHRSSGCFYIGHFMNIDWKISDDIMKGLVNSTEASHPTLSVQLISHSKPVMGSARVRIPISCGVHDLIIPLNAPSVSSVREELNHQFLSAVSYPSSKHTDESHDRTDTSTTGTLRVRMNIFVVQ